MGIFSCITTCITESILILNIFKKQYVKILFGSGYTYQDSKTNVIRVLSENSSLKPFFYTYNKKYLYPRYP